MTAINILVVEDNSEKAAAVMKCIREFDSNINIVVSSDIVSAKRELEQTAFDAAIIDIQIPVRFPSTPDPGGGGKLIREIESNSKLLRPKYIIGLSEFEDADDRCGQALSERAFGFIHYRRESIAWQAPLKKFLESVVSATNSAHRQGNAKENIDLLVICALEDPELSAVLRLGYGWEQLVEDGDCISYYRGTVKANSGERTVIAAAAMEPGMAAAAALCSRAITHYRPRYLVMTGITGGMRGDVNLGDIVAAEVIWDYTNGKHAVVDGKSAFRPSPRVIDVDAVVVSQLKRIAKLPGVLDKVYRDWPARRPDTALDVRVGPMFTGTSVVADAEKMSSLSEMHRKVIAVEMEAYSVMCAAKFGPQPRPTAFVIKSVSDYADQKKDDDWQAYASYTSAALLNEWAMRFL